MKTLSLLLIALIVFCSSCTSTKNALSSATIVGKYWKLVEVNGTNVAALQNSKEPFIIFSAVDERISGNAGCNNMVGGFRISEGNHIKISQIGTTRMLCEDMTIERQFLAALPEANTFIVEANRMQLRDIGGKVVATFELGNVKG